MDMLVAGMHGSGCNPETSLGGCTDEEYRTHFALWAMLASPLIIGCDIRNMSDTTRELLLNRDLIAINQDPACHSCYVLKNQAYPDVFILVRRLAGGETAVGLFQFGDAPAHVLVNLFDMGLTPSSRMGLRFYDCLSHEDAGFTADCFAADVPAHGCRVYRCSMEVCP